MYDVIVIVLFAFEERKKRKEKTKGKLLIFAFCIVIWILSKIRKELEAKFDHEIINLLRNTTFHEDNEFYLLFRFP